MWSFPLGSAPRQAEDRRLTIMSPLAATYVRAENGDGLIWFCLLGFGSHKPGRLSIGAERQSIEHGWTRRGKPSENSKSNTINPGNLKIQASTEASPKFEI